jgi:hypothetical protein
MLTTQSNETSILERIKLARGTTEPVAPTEEPQIVDVSEDDTPEEPTEEVAEVEETEDYTEEVEEESEEIAESDEMYLDLDGEEIPLSQVKEWKTGHMMQSDYTRKTTELSEQRKEFEAEREAFNANQAKLNETVAQLEAVIKSDELTSEELQEMREYEPDAYIKHIEKQNQRKEMLAEAKGSIIEQPAFDVQQEQQKLIANNPHWMKDGKPTKAYQDDLKVLNDYGVKVGITPEQFAKFDASMMQMAIDAARYSGSKNKEAAVTKKVRKAPVVTKPQQRANVAIHDKIKKAEAKFKRSGSIDDAMALKRLKKQLNN